MLFTNFEPWAHAEFQLLDCFPIFLKPESFISLSGSSSHPFLSISFQKYVEISKLAHYDLSQFFPLSFYFSECL